MQDPLENMIECLLDLLAAIEAGEVSALEQTTQRAAEALGQLRELSRGRGNEARLGRIDLALSLANAARARVNFLTPDRRRQNDGCYRFVHLNDRRKADREFMFQ